MAYCCHFSTAAPNFFFDMLGKLQKGVSRAFGPIFFASTDPLVHCQNVSRVHLVHYFI